MSYSSIGRIAAGLLAAFAWFGLARYLASEAAFLQGNWPSAVWSNLGYLTDLSNLLLAIVMTGIALGVQRLSRPAVVGWAVVAIATVGVGFWLSGGRLVLGKSALEDVLLHGVTPWAALLFWLVFAPKGRLAWRHALVWMAWPLFYWSYAMGRGLLLDRYPYSWLDPAKQGAAAVATTIAMMVVLYALWAVVLVLLDKWLGRRTGRSAGAVAS